METGAVHGVSEEKDLSDRCSKLRCTLIKFLSCESWDFLIWGFQDFDGIKHQFSLLNLFLQLNENHNCALADLFYV